MPPCLCRLLNLHGFPISLYFSCLCICLQFISFFLPSVPPPPISPFPLIPSLLPVSVVWSNNVLIIGCKKYLLRDYARYKKLTGDGSQNLSASLMRPGDCKACSAESQHPPPITPHRGLNQLCEKQPSPAQLSLARLVLCSTLACVINAFTASSSALVCQLLELGSFVGFCGAGCPLHPWFPLICSPPLQSCEEWTISLWSSVSWLHQSSVSHLVHLPRTE